MLPGRGRLWAFGAAALLVVAGVVAWVAVADGDSSDSDDDRLDVVVVGDSFVLQSRDQMLALAEERGIDMDVFAYNGVALCTFFETGTIDDLRRDPPRRLVLAFAGNALQHCSNPTCDNDATATSCQPQAPDVTAATYRGHIDQVLDEFADTDTTFSVVLPPPIGDEQFEAGAAAMRSMYRQLHDDVPAVQLVDTAPALDPDGQGFQLTLPCDDFDVDCPPSGEIVVRKEDDRIHLTPAGGERYARAVIDAIGG
jgi:hypothetical protein